MLLFCTYQLIYQVLRLVFTKALHKRSNMLSFNFEPIVMGGFPTRQRSLIRDFNDIANVFPYLKSIFRHNVGVVCGVGVLERVWGS